MSINGGLPENRKSRSSSIHLTMDVTAYLEKDVKRYEMAVSVRVYTLL